MVGPEIDRRVADSSAAMPSDRGGPGVVAGRGER
jgi:hypothetical protein